MDKRGEIEALLGDREVCSHHVTRLIFLLFCSQIRILGWPGFIPDCNRHCPANIANNTPESLPTYSLSLSRTAARFCLDGGLAAAPAPCLEATGLHAVDARPSRSTLRRSRRTSACSGGSAAGGR